MGQIKKRGSVPLSLSLYDLNHCLRGTGLTFEGLPEEKQNEILFYLGMDIGSCVEWFPCIHRTKFKPNNEPEEGILLTGVERVDSVWFLTGKASLENRINRHASSGFNIELRVMSATSNFTADIVDHIANKRDRKKD